MSLPTQEQIVNRIKTKNDNDWLNVTKENLISYLDYEHAKEFLSEKNAQKYLAPNPEYHWNNKIKKELDINEILEQMYGYMEFAWTKANNCRGISSVRNITHFENWLFLCGFFNLLQTLEELEKDYYQYYGKPLLVWVCQQFNWKWRQWDNGIWRNEEDGPTKKTDDAIKEFPFLK